MFFYLLFSENIFLVSKNIPNNSRRTLKNIDFLSGYFIWKIDLGPNRFFKNIYKPDNKSWQIEFFKFVFWITIVTNDENMTNLTLPVYRTLLTIDFDMQWFFNYSTSYTLLSSHLQIVVYYYSRKSKAIWNMKSEPFFFK